VTFVLLPMAYAVANWNHQRLLPFSVSLNDTANGVVRFGARVRLSRRNGYPLPQIGELELFAPGQVLTMSSIHERPEVFAGTNSGWTCTVNVYFPPAAPVNGETEAFWRTAPPLPYGSWSDELAGGLGVRRVPASYTAATGATAMRTTSPMSASWPGRFHPR